MFVNPTRLPHLLPPSAYYDAEHHERESTLLRSSWQLVGTTSELAREGDFLTCELLGQPVLVRRMGEQVVAFRNVCAHRHCRLTDARRGSSPRLRCQYHGWEYDADGCTARIPKPKNFMPLDRDVTRLGSLRVEMCGQLVFVSLAADGPSLDEQLGTLAPICRARFGEGWAPRLACEFDYAANWKVPIENSVEAYHVPCVHPHTFREDPGEDRSQHVLEPGHTALLSALPFSAHSRLDEWYQRADGWIVRRLGLPATRGYQQHHVFPNLLFSFTDATSLCHVIVPTGPTTSRAIVRQFGPCGVGVATRLLAGAWGRLAGAITHRILREDMQLFPAIQRGLECSTGKGVLGRCEERIHAFQQFMAKRCPIAQA